MRGLGGLLLAGLVMLLAAQPAKAQDCPVAGTAYKGYILHMTSGEAFRVDRIVDDVTFMRHLDNRGNTLNSQELYRGLFTLATLGGKGRTIYTYDVDPATFFPLNQEGYAEVGGQMISANGQATPVLRSWVVGGGGTKLLDSGHDRWGGCLYRFRTVTATTVWPSMGLEFRQEKQWSETLNMVIYLRTTVIENGVQTRDTIYDVDWIEE